MGNASSHKYGLSSSSTAMEATIAANDMTGKVVVVTGGASGIGLEIVRTFAKLGAVVVVGTPCRPHAPRRRPMSAC